MRDEIRAQMRGYAAGVGVEAGLFLGIFVVAGVVAAAIWNATVTAPQVVLYQGHLIPPTAVQATQTVGVDAVYLLVGLPIALVLGAGLMYWRRRTPVATVVILAVVSIFTAALMERLGLWFGPGDPMRLLQHSSTGTTAPGQLAVQATGVLLVWPVAAVLGALLVLLFAPPARFEPPVEVADPASQEQSAGDAGTGTRDEIGDEVVPRAN